MFWYQYYSKEDYSAEINAEDKLNGIFQYAVSRQRKKQVEKHMNENQKKNFLSGISSFEWSGSAVSPLCSFYSSCLQQKLPNIKVKQLLEQNNTIRFKSQG